MKVKKDMCKAFKDYRKQKKRLGKEEGSSIGKSQGIIKTLIRLLQLKFGNLSSNTLDTIQSCNQEQLDYLTIHIFDIQEEKDIIRYLQFV